jgi:hypothetical protein
LRFARKENGGVTELSWAPLIITPNYYDLFISLCAKHPNYELKKEEIQILVFMSQFMPRVLEQSFLSHYKPELNGSKNLSYIVNFSLSEWVPNLNMTRPNDLNSGKALIDNQSAAGTKINHKNIYKATDENNKIVSASSSMNGLALKLGLSIAGLKYHLGRESNVYAKALGVKVSFSKLGELPIGKPVDNYKSKNLLRKTLILKNISITSLELGFILWFNLDKETIFTKQPSSRCAAFYF